MSAIELMRPTHAGEELLRLKKQESSEIKLLTEKFLQKGGSITQCQAGKSSEFKDEKMELSRARAVKAARNSARVNLDEIIKRKHVNIVKCRYWYRLLIEATTYAYYVVGRENLFNTHQKRSIKIVDTFEDIIADRQKLRAKLNLPYIPENE